MSNVPHGTLDLLILQTLQTMGSMHGYAIARRIEQMAESLMRLSQGSIYPALIRLETQGLIADKWGTSETGRKVKYYSLTKAGEKRLKTEVEAWERSAALIGRFIAQQK